MLYVSISAFYLFHFRLCCILQVWFLRKHTADHLIRPIILKDSLQDIHLIHIIEQHFQNPYQFYEQTP